MADPATSGMAAAVADVLADSDQAGPLLPLREPVQLALIEEPGRRIDRAAVEALPRGVGRPRGAKNRRTEAWRDYLTRRYAHPLETLASIQSQPVDKLAAELGCKPVEALAIIKSAAAELAPYIESKMPVGVDLGVRAGLTLAIAGITHSESEVAAMVEPRILNGDIIEPEIAEYQDVDESEKGPSE